MKEPLKACVAAIMVFATAQLWGKSPDWILKDNYTNKIVKVSEVVGAENADIVKLDTGLESNLRIGAVCSIRREGKSIGKMILVDSSEGRSVGLALEGAKIRKGDTVHITPLN